MRWIVISLLVVNALILGWRWYAASEPAAPAAVPMVTAASGIELLPDGEVSPALASESAPADEITERTSTELSAPPAAVTVEANIMLAPESALTSEPAVQSTPVDSAAENADSSRIAVDSPASEHAPTHHVADTAPAAEATPVQSAAHCAWTAWRERPVTDLGAAESLQTEQQEQEIGRSYLVYIPAKASRELTLQRLAELKTQGIEAAYLNKGPQAGGISLGLFSKPESMQVRLQELKKAGIADSHGVERIRTEPRIRQLLRWTGEKTPSSVQNQALVSCNDIAPATAGQ